MQIADLPVQRTAPRALLDQLEALDRRTRLVYAGDGRWWLGLEYDGDDPLRAATVRSGLAQLTGMATLDGMRLHRQRRADQVLHALLKVCGFYWQAQYVVQGEPTGAIANDWQERVWTHLHQRDEAWDALEYELSGQARHDRAQVLAREAAIAEAPTAHRLAFRKPVTINL